ncbi:MarR family transcriptional regulator [Streptomyces sp. AB3(2024)]|uniref:MarR family transcriptional regulator n=1 Tax=Streptomyces sp. AB3(2024) TaxID=3317321 RepID=UPI0035A348D7
MARGPGRDGGGDLLGPVGAVRAATGGRRSGCRAGRRRGRRRGRRATLPARLRELPSRLFWQASAHAQRFVTEVPSGSDAHKWHYAAPIALDEFGPASRATPSGRTGIHRSDLVSVITLTPAGRRRLRKLEQLLTAAQEELLSPLSAPERKELTRLLGLLVAHHARSGPTMGADDR